MKFLFKMHLLSVFIKNTFKIHLSRTFRNSLSLNLPLSLPLSLLISLSLSSSFLFSLIASPSLSLATEFPSRGEARGREILSSLSSFCPLPCSSSLLLALSLATEIPSRGEAKKNKIKNKHKFPSLSIFLSLSLRDVRRKERRRSSSLLLLFLFLSPFLFRSRARHPSRDGNNFRGEKEFSSLRFFFSLSFFSLQLSPSSTLPSPDGFSLSSPSPPFLSSSLFLSPAFSPSLLRLATGFFSLSRRNVPSRGEISSPFLPSSFPFCLLLPSPLLPHHILPLSRARETPLALSRARPLRGERR